MSTIFKWDTYTVDNNSAGVIRNTKELQVLHSPPGPDTQSADKIHDAPLNVVNFIFNLDYLFQTICVYFHYSIRLILLTLHRHAFQIDIEHQTIDTLPGINCSQFSTGSKCPVYIFLE